MIERYIEPLSTYAGDIDSIIWLILLLVGPWFIVC